MSRVLRMGVRVFRVLGIGPHFLFQKRFCGLPRPPGRRRIVERSRFHCRTVQQHHIDGRQPFCRLGRNEVREQFADPFDHLAAIADRDIRDGRVRGPEFGQCTLEQQAETSSGSPIQTNHYYLVGNGVRTNYGGEVYSSGTLALRDVNSPPYVETIGLSGSETATYVDTPVIPSGGAQTSISIQRTYVARETVSLKNGKVFDDACHYRTTETLSNPVRTSTTTADDWLAPGVGMVKSVADIGGIQILTRELESATVGGKSY